MRRAIVILVAAALLAAACGDDDSSDSGTDSGTDATEQDTSSDVALSGDDVCALLTPAEITNLTGEALPAEPSEPDDVFPNCSWNTGTILVQIDVGAEDLVFAPGEECPSVDLGEQGADCDHTVQFISNGMRVIISTDGFALTPGGEGVDVLAVAQVIEPKVGDLG